MRYGTVHYSQQSRCGKGRVHNIELKGRSTTGPSTGIDCLKGGPSMKGTSCMAKALQWMETVSLGRESRGTRARKVGKYFHPSMLIGWGLIFGPLIGQSNGQWLHLGPGHTQGELASRRGLPIIVGQTPKSCVVTANRRRKYFF